MDNVPSEAKEQFMRPDESADDRSEYRKCSDDYLSLMHDGDTITHGMMYKNGVKYKLERMDP